MANSTLTTLTAVLQMNNTKFKKGVKGAEKSLTGFQKQVKAIGGMIAAAFTVGAIANFAKESLNLAMQLEGVALAFDRIRPNVRFMNELKEATHGTVSELNLMKRAVMASNFQIPLEQLATLLEFATKRAQDTGESVDYLVNSIIMGIGRKSPLILDNLGISAVALRNKLEHVGHSGATVMDVAKAVAEIAAEAMADAGEVVDTVSIKFERLKAKIKDASAEFGQFLAGIPDRLHDVSASLDPLFEGPAVAAKKTKKVWDWLFEGFYIAWDKAKKKSYLYAEALEIINTKTEKVVKTTRGLYFQVSDLWAMSFAIMELGEEIYKTWVKENDIVRDRIALQEDLINAINDTRLANLEELKEITKAYDKIKKAKKEAERKKIEQATYEPTLPGQEDKVWTGGDEGHPVLSKALLAAEKKFQDMKDRMETLKEEMNRALESFVEQGLTNIFAGLGEALVTKDLENFFASILRMFGSFMVQMGGMIVAYGIAMDAFKNAFATPFAAIAAGVALAAVGGAIIGASKMLSSKGGGTISQNSSPYGGNNVTFEISGQNLVGVMDRQNGKTGRFT